MRISPKTTWLLLAITLGTAAPRAQGSEETRSSSEKPGFEEAQIEAAKATDARFMGFVTQFRDLVVKTWGAESKIGRLDATESRIQANIHVGDDMHPVRMTPRRFKEDKRFELREAEGTGQHLQDLSCLDETRLRRLVELAHALPGGAKAHLFQIKMAYFPEPPGRFVAAIQLIGVDTRVDTAFDMTTGDPIDLGPPLVRPPADPATAPVARRPRGGLREWLAVGRELLTALEKIDGPPAAVLSLEFSAAGVAAELLEAETPVLYRFDNQGLKKMDGAEPPVPACKEPFDPRQVELHLLGELADRALAAVDIPYRSLVDARIERGPICGAPQIRFRLRSPNAAAEVFFDADGEQIRSELR